MLPSAPSASSSRISHDVRQEAGPHRLHQEQAGRSRASATSSRASRRVHRERLLHEHWLAGAQREPSAVEVHRRRRRHIDHVDLGIRDERRVARVAVGNAEALAEPLRRFGCAASRRRRRGRASLSARSAANAVAIPPVPITPHRTRRLVGVGAVIPAGTLAFGRSSAAWAEPTRTGGATAERRARRRGADAQRPQRPGGRPRSRCPARGSRRGHPDRGPAGARRRCVPARSGHADPPSH